MATAPKPKIWVTPQTAYAPGTLARMEAMSPRARSKKRHPATKAHEHLSNRLAAAAHQDVWRHKGELSGQR